jgi:general secretion pathway protein L
LRPLLSFELDRHSPIDPELVYFDHIVVGRDRRAKRLNIEMRMVRRATVDQALAHCRANGLTPSALGFIGDGHDFALERTGAVWRWPDMRKSLAAVPAILAVSLAVAALFGEMAREERDMQALSAKLAEEKPAAEAVINLRREVERTRNNLAFLPGKKQTPPVTKVFAEVSRLLPRGSWIFQFELTGREVRLRGYSPTASSLIGIFGESTSFANARFRAPLTQGPRPDLERFDLSFDLKGI